MQSQFIFDVNEQNIQQIIQESMTIPVMFYFWSERSPHCQELTNTLTQLANEYDGRFILAKLNCDEQQMLASQFGLRAIPTVYLFQNGQPVDGFQGPQPEDVIKSLLNKVLPSEDEIALEKAKNLVENAQYSQALPLLKQARETLKNHFGHPRTDIALLLVKSHIELKQIDEAKEILATVPLQDHDTIYQGLLSEIELLEQAANSPEIQQLQTALNDDPTNTDLIIQLALQLNLVGRNEEALALIFAPLQKDLSAGDGKVKKTLLDMLAALGTDNTLASSYRRKLYSLLY